VVQRRQVLREMMLEGVTSIVDKVNPRVLESKLAVYLDRPAVLQSMKLAAK
jgi:flagellar motor component MotA